MSVRNTPTGWGWPARLLHWVMALMILALLGVGFYMANLTTDLAEQFRLTQTHKSVGFTVFVLAVLRVAWRLLNRAPDLPEAMPAWQVRASHLSHVALYGLILWMPLTGWLMASSSPLNDPGAYPVQIRNMVFGLFEMPDPFATGSETLTDTFNLLHTAGAIALALILVVHAGAALKHHLVDRDRVLMRMIRGR